MLKDKIINIYKQNVFTRCDDTGSIYYFSHKDFKDLKFEDYEFLSSKGYVLKGKIYYYDNYKPNHLVVFDHGMGGGHLSYFKEIELLARNGFKVLSYDHSGCMESGGQSTGGFCQSLCDLNDLFISLKANDKFNNYVFSVVGHSWGAFSTMNIPYFHKDIKHVVAMSGFISLEQVLKQNFKGLLSSVYDEVYNIEKESNPGYVNVNAINSLKSYEGKALIIHSKDDKTVNYKFHFNVLKEELKNNNNINFILLNKKRHNPNYTEEAVNYKDKFFKIYIKQLKKGKLVTEEQKEKFKNSFDWNKMTEQDLSVWEEIIKVLKDA